MQHVKWPWMWQSLNVYVREAATCTYNTHTQHNTHTHIHAHTHTHAYTQESGHCFKHTTSTRNHPKIVVIQRPHVLHTAILVTSRTHTHTHTHMRACMHTGVWSLLQFTDSLTEATTTYSTWYTEMFETNNTYDITITW